MPDEYDKPTELRSFSVLSDLDGDGYPEIALGGQAWDAPSVASTPGGKPREGVFEEGASDGYRFYVFRGGPDPYRTTLPVIARAGEPYAGMTAAGDLDGDGFPDVVAIDTRPVALHEYTGASPWTDSVVGYRGGRVLVTYGGPALRSGEIASPSFFRERPNVPDAPGLWTGLIPSHNAYRDVPGIRTVTPARVREELFLPVSVGSAGDVDGDGFFDLAFTFLGPMRAPDVSAPWDAHSEPDPRVASHHPAQGGLPAYTDYSFTGFLDVRHGSKGGPAPAALELLRSPTAKASPSLSLGTWLSFPHVEARVNGIFAAERRENMHMNPPYFMPFAGVYAGPPGALTLVP